MVVQYGTGQFFFQKHLNILFICLKNTYCGFCSWFVVQTLWYLTGVISRHLHPWGWAKCPWKIPRHWRAHRRWCCRDRECAIDPLYRLPKGNIWHWTGLWLQPLTTVTAFYVLLRYKSRNIFLHNTVFYNLYNRFLGLTEWLELPLLWNNTRGEWCVNILNNNNISFKCWKCTCISTAYFECAKEIRYRSWTLHVQSGVFLPSCT